MSRRAPYGTWSTPITADALVQSVVRLPDVFVDPATRSVYHIERRPSEGGRAVIVDSASGKDVFGEGWNATSRVIEYGGASAIAQDGIIYFSHSPDGRVYRTTVGAEPKAVTPDEKPFRYADFSVHPIHKHLLAAVLEDHTVDTPSGVVNNLVVVNTKTQSITTIVKGADFYSSPRFSPSGSHIVYKEWNHPDMPWQKASLHVAKVTVNDGVVALSEDIKLAWEDREVGVGLPSWIDNDTLLFLTDESGYQNPWIFRLSSRKHEPLLPSPIPQDFSLPDFSLGDSPYAILPSMDADKSIIFSAFKNGRQVLFYFSLKEKALIPVEFPFVELSAVRAVDESTIVCKATSTTAAAAVIRLHLLDVATTSSTTSLIRTTHTVLKSSTGSSPFPLDIISQAEPIELQTKSGDPLHVVLYLPTNPDYEGSDSQEKPPCVVNAHGGPTSMVNQGLDWMTQYFTSRGWAWLDINYSGSCGYGRKYIDRLNGSWGIADVNDRADAAAILAAPPFSRIDLARTAIRGRSAGGYTVLATLTTRPDAFAAGNSLFGISDLVKFGGDTHKYESRYLDKLMGGAYAEIPEVYRARSPVNNGENIKSPLLILQGLDDKVVPPEQADLIIEKIQAHGGHVESIRYEGEGHGWTKAETTKDALEAERKFYEKVFKIGV